MTPDSVLDFWFPDDGHWTELGRHREFWRWRMTGCADRKIIDDYADVTEAAARGQLDHWAETPRGRLALVIALDQFPRSYWRDRPEAYGQDIKTTRLVIDAMKDGFYNALPTPWEKLFCIIAVSHCEGPDHLARMDLCVDATRKLVDEAPAQLRPMYVGAVDQNLLVRSIIERFGRHPHRNAVLGRITTDAERDYVARGDFPHQREIPGSTAESGAAPSKAGMV
ncbi:MAG: DUF924 domain-containing protein [Rhodobacteraceae bacterium]|nr:DUF924 domain-containing protein [Paracoccaceae bacterium]